MLLFANDLELFRIIKTPKWYRVASVCFNQLTILCVTLIVYALVLVNVKYSLSQENELQIFLFII